MIKDNEGYLSWIDIAKGIGIILVVIGHCFRDEMRANYYICEFIYELIYSFHMPLFFSISGITFYISYKKYINNKKLFIKKKVQTLLVPFATYGFIIYILFRIAYIIPMIGQMLNNSSFLKTNIGEYILDNLKCENPYAVHLWFIWIIFLSNIFMFLLLSNYKLEKVKCQVQITCLLLLLNILFLDIPIMTLQYFLKNMPYFCIGIIIAQKSNILYNKNRISKIIELSSWFLAIILILYKTIWKPIDFYRYIEPVALMIINFNIILSIFHFSIWIKRNTFLEKLGKDSFAIYLLHQPLCCGFAGLVFYNFWGFSVLFTCLFCIGFSFIFPYFVIFIIKKNKWLRLLAKWGLNIS